MGFVQIGFLAALGAVAIPIIVHLIARRRTRQVDLGTLRFLKVVLHENARRRKVKRWLLLALRTTCVALLALLFARPYLRADQLTRGNRLVVLLVDRSGSMGLETQRGRLIDLAVLEVKKILGGSAEGTQFELAFFDDRVHPVDGKEGGAFQQSNSASSVARIIDKLGLPETTYGATDYGRALSWARDRCVQSKRGRKSIFLITDLQRSGLDRTECAPLPPDVEVHVVDLGEAYPENTAVTSAQTARPVLRQEEPVTITSTLFNAGPFPLEQLPVLLHLENQGQRHELHDRVDLDAGATATLQFELPRLAEGLWHGRVTVDVQDDLVFDNRRHVAFLVAPRVRVLLIDGAPSRVPLLAETYFLETALRLAPPGNVYAESPFEPSVVPLAGDAALPAFENARLVVLANVADISAADAGRLGKFVSQGGGLLVFTGDNVRAERDGALRATGLSVGKIQGMATESGLPWRFEQWDEGHPVFEPFNDPQHGDLRRVAFRTITQIEPAEDARVLASFRGGAPAVLERQHGKGRVLWFASACDRDWSSWPRERLFLPLVHQMLGYLAGRVGEGPVRETRIDEEDPAEGSAVPGVFPGEGFWKVINVTPRESETARCSREEFAGRFNITLQTDQVASPDDVARTAVVTADLREGEIWHWLVFALLGIALVECFVANRTAA